MHHEKIIMWSGREPSLEMNVGGLAHFEAVKNARETDSRLRLNSFEPYAKIIAGVLGSYDLLIKHWSTSVGRSHPNP